MSVRRSARASGPRTKYTDDPFEAAGVLSDGSGTNKSPKGKGKARAVSPMDISESDEEFAAPPDDDEEDEEFGGEDGGDATSEDGSSPPASEIVMKEPDEERERILKAAIKPPKPKDLSPHEGKATKDEEQRHSRGLYIPLSRTGKTSSLHVTFGTDERDLLAMVYARDRWFRGVDSMFPTRRSLNEAEKFPDYGYGPTFGADPEDLKKERTHGWDWYYDADSGERFRKKQRLERIGENEARQIYMPPPQGKHTILIGPADDQKAIELGINEVFNFGEVWGERTSGEMVVDTKASAEATDAKPQSMENRKVREGWLINFGQKIQAMGWAPNQPGLTQYLAVIAPITEEQKANYPDPLRNKVAPAFRPSAPYPSALQLWTFKAKRENCLTKTIDMDFKPRLRLALCASWGDLRRFAWCPMARDSRAEDDKDVLRNIGLLAGVWSDGVVRVIDVKITRSADATEFYKVQSPVFEAKPPSTICTCVTWLSPSDIAVGCADGFVAVWNITSTQPTSANPFPYFYKWIHSSYVLSITSAYPAYPHLIATTSMDGETRLSSILQPHTDVTEATRMRMGSPHIVFSPILQSFLSSEENESIRLLVLRRFFTSTSVARLSSAVSALATPSLWHPAIMIGCTSGAVLATNPIRRILSVRVRQWQVTWFTHEWVPREGSSGVSRFLDGFRAEQVALQRNLSADRNKSRHSVTTIFEEGTHVTALAWNPNQSCAGWASAGMGCGLVRVEDVAL